MKRNIGLSKGLKRLISKQTHGLRPGPITEVYFVQFAKAQTLALLAAAASTEPRVLSKSK